MQKEISWMMHRISVFIYRVWKYILETLPFGLTEQNKMTKKKKRKPSRNSWLIERPFPFKKTPKTIPNSAFFFMLPALPSCMLSSLTNLQGSQVATGIFFILHNFCFPHLQHWLHASLPFTGIFLIFLNSFVTCQLHAFLPLYVSARANSCDEYFIRGLIWIYFGIKALHIKERTWKTLLERE